MTADPVGIGVLRTMQCMAHAGRLEWSDARVAGEQAIAALPRGSMWWYRAMQHLFMVAPTFAKSERVQQLIDDFSRARPEADAMSAYVASAAQLIVFTALLGDRDHSSAFLIYLEQIAEPFTETDALIRAWTAYAQSFFSHAFEADPTLAMTKAAESVQAFAEAKFDGGYCQAQTLHGLTLGHLGFFEKGEAALRLAAAHAHSLREPFLVRWCQVHLALFLSDFGAAATLEEACTLGRQAMSDPVDPVAYSIGSVTLARALLRQNSAVEAVAVARAALAPAAPTTGLYRLPLNATLCDALLRHGDVKAADAAAREVLESLEALEGTGWSELPALVSAALALSASGDLIAYRCIVAQAYRQLARRTELFFEVEQRQHFLAAIADPCFTLLSNATKRHVG